MELFEAINRRHSYRGAFRDTAIPRADLQRIVQAGLQAPSGRNLQTTTFVIVDEPQLVREIATMPGANAAQQNARAFILCINDTEPVVVEGMCFQVEDCAAATANILLAATALGYASVWIDGWLRREGRARAIGQLVGLPESETVRILLPLGIPAEERSQAAKKPFAERAWFNQYGG